MEKNNLTKIFDINKNPRLNTIGYVDAKGFIRL